MGNRIIRGTYFAIIVFAVGVGAQQSVTPLKAQESKPPGASTEINSTSQKVVLKIGSDQVTEAEINALISKLDLKAKGVVASQGKRPVADEYIRTLLLSQRALEQHLDQDPDIRMELELQRRQILAQAEYNRISSENPVSEEDIQKYYEAHGPEFDLITVQEFAVQKAPAAGQNFGSAKGIPYPEAKSKAEGVRKALLSGKDVDKVAEMYPIKTRVVLVDRNPRTVRRTDMKPELAEAFFATKDGGISPVVDTTQALFVGKVYSRQHLTLKDTTVEIRKKLQRQRLDAEVDVLKTKTGIWMDEEYFKKPAEAKSTEATGAAESKPRNEP